MKKAVLVIDVQQALFDAVKPPYEAQAVISNINQVTAWARVNNIPIIYIQHERPDTPLAYQSVGWNLANGLEHQSTDFYIRKSSPDSFLRTDLKVLLEQYGIEHLIICGYATEFCIDTTVRKAASLGYSIELVADAHTTHDKSHASAQLIREHHNAILPQMLSFDVSIKALPASELVASSL
ncbi:cysteine hydrolase family protein [uncultured Thiothrix sp.]|uniref:cysteine hydrolase family protein n=1 Tax=uncultured Thiothrix sp. TaxID=223185 RepID=UPI00260FB0E3|nr:cysteine hydrolase family protein [uncultured Thiothrix sp.]